MGLFNCRICLEGPGQVIGDLDTSKLEALDHFHFVPIDVDSLPLFPEVDDYLFRFVDIEGGIIVAVPVHQILYVFLYSISSLFEI